MNSGSVQYEDIIKRNGVALGEHQIVQLRLYCSFLEEWNAKVNLISRKDEANIWPNHILHSLSILFSVSIPDGARVADIGSGGGLPGIPLAIAAPTLGVVLIESIRKKCLALSDMVERLGLVNVKVLNARVEDVGEKYSCFFDVVLARAVAPLLTLVQWSSPLVRTKSDLRLSVRNPESVSEPLCLPALIALKGGDLEEEISDSKKGPRAFYFRSLPIQFDGIENTSMALKQIVVVGLKP